MIRNLKVLFAAAMVLGALGVLGAASAQAAEPLFHCSVAPCKLTLKPDGTLKTEHHVFIVKNNASPVESISFTCNTLDGTATSSSLTFTTATVTNLEYTTCIQQADSSVVKVRTNGCDYTLTSHGKVGVTCPEGKVIEVENATGCIMEIPGFVDKEKVTYHNLGTSPNREVTVSPLVTGIHVTTKSSDAQCGIKVVGKTLTGEYTTGNTIATAETDPKEGAGSMIDGWWE
jgi:hypothetical protein